MTSNFLDPLVENATKSPKPLLSIEKIRVLFPEVEVTNHLCYFNI